MEKVSFGILSTAKIGVEKVIPALQLGERTAVTAIASRDHERASQAAAQLGIPHAYGSYEQLLADDSIQAVYIPLPNHMHVPWSLKCLEAGKHVLCEKPIGLSVEEAEHLAAEAAKYPKLKVMEAFMYRLHPQWKTAQRIVADGGIGRLRAVHSLFSYFNDDPTNIRNQVGIGGGAMMDIGCYCVSLARLMFDSEPLRACAVVDFDPQLKVDRLSSGLLEFAAGQASFVCSTQLTPYQRVQILGTSGRIEIEIPFNAPPERACRIWHETQGSIEEIQLPICDQYTIQGDLFARSILEDTSVPTPLDDATNNMRAIEAILTSGREHAWVNLNRSS